MTGDRMNPGLITEVLDVLDRHGYVRSDDEHTVRAIVLIGDLTHVYEGSLDHPFGPYINEPPSRTEPEPPTSAGHDGVIVPARELKTLLAALDVAADHQRDRAETCAECTGQSCLTCQSRLQDAQAYDRIAVHLIQGAEASAAAAARHPGSVSQPQPATDREAGQ